MKNAALLALTFFLVSCAHSGKGDQEAFEAAGVTFRAMSVEHLPNLSMPRGGHHTVILGDEITVFGGHTDARLLRRRQTSGQQDHAHGRHPGELRGGSELGRGNVQPRHPCFQLGLHPGQEARQVIGLYHA